MVVVEGVAILMQEWMPRLLMVSITYVMKNLTLLRVLYRTRCKFFICFLLTQEWMLLTSGINVSVFQTVGYIKFKFHCNENLKLSKACKSFL